MSPWAYLGIAIIFEVIGTVLLKLSNGFENMGTGLVAIFFYCLCFPFMALAFRAIPAGVAYAVWSGVGIVAITVVGLFAFKQNLSLLQYGFIILIILGAIGLNLTTKVS